MAVVMVRDLLRMFDAVPSCLDRQYEGVRLVYDQTHLTMTSPVCPQDVLARAETRGYPTAAWELTMYAVNAGGVRSWMRALEMDPTHGRIDVSPFWGGTGSVLVCFTGAHGAGVSFPVIACPSAPRERGGDPW